MNRQPDMALGQTADVVEFSVTPLTDYGSEGDFPIQVQIKKFSNHGEEDFTLLPATKEEISALALYFGVSHTFSCPVGHEIVPGQTVIAKRLSSQIVKFTFITDSEINSLLQDHKIKKSISINVSVDSTFAFEDLLNETLQPHLSQISTENLTQLQFASVA